MSAPHPGPIPFAMPSLGADMEEGRITEWLVRPGDHVERGQIVVVVETDKSDIEVEVFQPATVAELLVAEGDVVPVGAPIASLTPDTGAPTRPVPAPLAAERATTRAAHLAEPAPPVSARPGRITSPVLRHLAGEMHVDAGHLHGSGPGGRVARDDVVRAAGPVAPRGTRRRITPRARRLLAARGWSAADVPGDGLVTGTDVLTLAPPRQRTTVRTPSRQESMRRHIADLMATSWREIPHFHLAQRLDLTTAVARLARANEARALSDRIVPGALLLCAAARAVARAPGCNGWWRDGGFTASETVDLGLVLSLRSGGIIVPTIERADELSPPDMMRRMTELVQRARQGRLRASDLGEASVTVTSLGDRGADSVSGVIHPPQVVLVGFGALRDDVWAGPEGVGIRPTVQATLAGDHRAIDGLAGSRVLAQMQALLDGALPSELDDVEPDQEVS